MPASPPRRLFRLYRTVAAPGRVHDLRFEDYRGCDTRVASHLLRMACRHVRREDQQIAFRIVAVKCVAAIGRSLAARRQRQHMVFFQKPYDSRIDAGFMFGFLRPGAFRCILRISGFSGIPDFSGAFLSVPRLFRVSCLFPGWLPASSCPRACYRTVPDPGFPACRPADVPCLSLRPFSPVISPPPVLPAAG